jgi:hypothetical protein
MNAVRGLVRHYNSASSGLFAKATVGGLVFLSGATQTALRLSMTIFFIYATSLVNHMDQELVEKTKPKNVIYVERQPPELK